jgi:AmmeMemoRadiSam system protein B/AmmeMemoRadiSam system protein A
MQHLLSIALLLWSCFFSSCSKSQENAQPPAPIVHQAHLSAGWYQTNAAQLQHEIDAYFDQAQQYFPTHLSSVPRALIVPHAGHRYSGLCAATAYQTLLDAKRQPNTTIKRVIIMAPTHSTFYNGIALPGYTVYRMPNGDIPLDTQALKKLEKKDKVFSVFAQAHETEHSLEIQLPFLQQSIASFQLIPLIVGHLSDEQIFLAAEALKKVLTPDSLLVISSDFTHHGPSYEYIVFDKNINTNLQHLDAMAIKTLTAPSFESFVTLLHQTSVTICGQEPLKILLALLETDALGDMQAHLTCYYNSAQLAWAQKETYNPLKLFDNPPDKEMQSSVSYVGMVYAAPSSSPREVLTGYEQQALLRLARTIIEHAFDKSDKEIQLPLISPGLMFTAGAFVTLNTKKGDLRGCIGRITTDKPLYSTVASMAQAAAFNDTRFEPLRKEELDNIVIDITILTPPQKVASADDIIVGQHGVILNKRGESGNVIASAVFLPQVAREWHWDRTTMLEQLCLKAGLDRNAWKTNCDFEVFEGFEFKEAHS